MKKYAEKRSLIRIYFSVKMQQIKQELWLIKNYYKSFSFAFADTLFRLFYLFINPYRVSRKFLQNKQVKNLHTYGETPIISWQKILKEIDIQPCTHLYELGAGRARHCLWSHYFIPCKITAIEQIRIFTRIGQWIQKIARIKDIKFINSDFMKVDLSSADVIFLFGTCLEDKEIKYLIEKFKVLKKTIRIVTISYPLTDYDLAFQIEKEFDIEFFWGQTQAYIQKLKNL